ncbi:MAG: SemiSWEET family transporter [Capnocytophaga sp.]|nr:SemiSWEET family transporter [Capnocytophaga sp.]
MIDLIGYAASFFVVLSFLIKENIIYIRLTNLVGCVLFVIYGFLIDSIPIILPNAFLVFVQIYYVVKTLHRKK